MKYLKKKQPILPAFFTKGVFPELLSMFDILIEETHEFYVAAVWADWQKLAGRFNQAASLLIQSGKDWVIWFSVVLLGGDIFFYFLSLFFYLTDLSVCVIFWFFYLVYQNLCLLLHALAANWCWQRGINEPNCWQHFV